MEGPRVGGMVLCFLAITGTMLALPRIGMALTFGLVVAGQLVVAVMLDHYNILVSEQHSMNLWRLGGIALIIVGVVILRKF